MRISCMQRMPATKQQAIQFVADMYGQRAGANGINMMDTNNSLYTQSIIYEIMVEIAKKQEVPQITSGQLNAFFQELERLKRSVPVKDVNEKESSKVKLCGNTINDFTNQFVSKLADIYVYDKEPSPDDLKKLQYQNKNVYIFVKSNSSLYHVKNNIALPFKMAKETQAELDTIFKEVKPNQDKKVSEEICGKAWPIIVTIDPEAYGRANKMVFPDNLEKEAIKTKEKYEEFQKKTTFFYNEKERFSSVAPDMYLFISRLDIKSYFKEYLELDDIYKKPKYRDEIQNNLLIDFKNIEAKLLNSLNEAEAQKKELEKEAKKLDAKRLVILNDKKLVKRKKIDSQDKENVTDRKTDNIVQRSEYESIDSEDVTTKGPKKKLADLNTKYDHITTLQKENREALQSLQVTINKIKFDLKKITASLKGEKGEGINKLYIEDITDQIQNFIRNRKKLIKKLSKNYQELSKIFFIEPEVISLQSFLTQYMAYSRNKDDIHRTNQYILNTLIKEPIKNENEVNFSEDALSIEDLPKVKTTLFMNPSSKPKNKIMTSRDRPTEAQEEISEELFSNPLEEKTNSSTIALKSSENTVTRLSIFADNKSQYEENHQKKSPKKTSLDSPKSSPKEANKEKEKEKEKNEKTTLSNRKNT